jgi:hypothetical protein
MHACCVRGHSSLPRTQERQVENHGGISDPVLCEKWIVQNRRDIERFSSVLPERSSANPWFLALSCLTESQL